MYRSTDEVWCRLWCRFTVFAPARLAPPTEPSRHSKLPMIRLLRTIRPGFIDARPRFLRVSQMPRTRCRPRVFLAPHGTIAAGLDRWRDDRVGRQLSDSATGLAPVRPPPNAPKTPARGTEREGF